MQRTNSQSGVDSIEVALVLIALIVQNMSGLGAFAHVGRERKDKRVWLDEVKCIDQSSMATRYIRTSTLTPGGIP